MKARVCDICGRIINADEYGIRERYTLWVTDPIYSEKKLQRLDMCSTCREKIVEYIKDGLTEPEPERDPTFNDVMEKF